MIENVSVIDTVEGQPLLVSWDLGRRCNFDCTYCPAHRHDNHSPMASFEELQSAGNFVFAYLAQIMPYKKIPYVSISFTGGEPTLNPHFIRFGQWLRQEHDEKYKNIYNLNLSVTSNGAMGRAMCESLLENYNFATISYHCEAPERLKALSVENIFFLKEAKFEVSVNVMFHARKDYFDECIDLCAKLKEGGVSFVPRLIGEHDDDNRYHHKYTDEQMDWMRDYWQQGKKPQAKAPAQGQTARSLGRPCCSKRGLKVCGTGSEWSKTSFLPSAKFKDWYCSVNWFFLHIEQQSGQIFHHQTCQANFGGRREPIGTLAQSQDIVENLKKNIDAKTMPLIVCPNKICGCGLCTPKARDFADLKNILPEHVDVSVFANNPLFKLSQSPSGKGDLCP